MNPRALSLPLLPAIALLLTGCTLAPKYSRPPAPTPTSWPAGPAYAHPQPAPDLAPATDLPWQEYFVDPDLRRVIELALDGNRDLRLAALNVERARALYGIARAELFPTVDGTVAGSRQSLPADLSPSGRRQTVERYDAHLGVASWEIDFFGRIRSLKDRALQEFLAGEQARRGSQILLVSAVAEAFLALAADRDALRLSETTLESQQAAFDLVRRRHELGLVPELELFRARAPLDIARRDVAVYTRRVAQDENALTLLVGTNPPPEALPEGLGEVLPPADLRPGLPSEVLLSRPDVMQAEHLLRAAHADIGAARAAFFPRISLSTTLGTASSDLSGLFQSGAGTWSYAPQLVMPLFDARTWSAARAARVQRDLAVTQYEKAIQSAFRDVADALAARGTIDQQVAAQESLVHASAETYRLARSRFDRGIDSYLGVLDAQRSLFAAEQVLVFLRLESLASRVRLYAVLGGGASANPGLATARPSSF